LGGLASFWTSPARFPPESKLDCQSLWSTLRKKGFHDAAYLTSSAVLLNASGDPIEALSYIEARKKLEKNRYSTGQRATAWIDWATAESHLRMRNYDQATILAIRALEVYLDLHHIGNIVVIRDLYGRLLSTSYGNSKQVEELGYMLRRGEKAL